MAIDINLTLPTLPTQDQKDAMDGANNPNSGNTFFTQDDFVAAGNDTEVQFNDNGAFNGDPRFTYSKADNELIITDTVTDHSVRIKNGNLSLWDNTQVVPLISFQFDGSTAFTDYRGTGNKVARQGIDTDGAGYWQVFTAAQDLLMVLDPVDALKFLVDASGDVSIPNFAGGGTLMVTTDNDGKLGTQAIPTGGGTGVGEKIFLFNNFT